MPMAPSQPFWLNVYEFESRNLRLIDGKYVEQPRETIRFHGFINMSREEALKDAGGTLYRLKVTPKPGATFIVKCTPGYMKTWLPSEQTDFV